MEINDFHFSADLFENQIKTFEFKEFYKILLISKEWNEIYTKILKEVLYKRYYELPSIDLSKFTKYKCKCLFQNDLTEVNDVNIVLNYLNKKMIIQTQEILKKIR